MSEAKVKMIPSKFPHVQDPKGIKQGKDRNVLDRKNPSKVDRSWISSVTTSSAVSTSKVEQKLSSRGETNFGNNRDQKIIQSDGISSTHPKSRSSLVHMGVDNPLSPGISFWWLNKIDFIFASLRSIFLFSNCRVLQVLCACFLLMPRL